MSVPVCGGGRDNGAMRPAERGPMHWTKWSWLALVSAQVIVAVACILFAPDLMALRRAIGK